MNPPIDKLLWDANSNAAYLSIQLDEANARIVELEAALNGLWCIMQYESGTSCAEIGHIHFDMTGQTESQ